MIEIKTATRTAVKKMTELTMSNIQLPNRSIFLKGYFFGFRDMKNGFENDLICITFSSFLEHVPGLNLSKQKRRYFKSGLFLWSPPREIGLNRLKSAIFVQIEY